MGQRWRAGLFVEGSYGAVNGGVEIKGLDESLMGETMLLAVARSMSLSSGAYFWQPLDGEPARSDGERGEG